MLKGTLTRCTSWSRTVVAQSVVYEPRAVDDVRKVLDLGQVLPRGGGMSFGDAGLSDKGNVIDLKFLAKPEDIEFDSKAGILCCPAGISQIKILEHTGPEGWVLPAIPGSAKITIGGSVAADAHGKNHFARSSISSHLISLVIMLASGDVVEVSRENMPDLFWATVGGLGLTGVVLRVKLKMQRFRSCYAIQQMIGFESVDEMVDVIEKRKDQYEYLLGWVDGDFKPGNLWHGAVSIGRDASVDETSDPWKIPRRNTITLPFLNPLPKGGLLAGRVVNKAIGLKFKGGEKKLIDINRFFFPQDAVSNWNLVFGRAGFVDYQCCIPFFVSREFLTCIHQFLNKHRVFCFLVVVKRFGSPEKSGPLTFAQDGISLALDIPFRPGITELLKLLDEIVVDFGGRINLVKDSRLPSEMLRKMYPRFDEWRTIRNKYDPEGIFSSDLSRRLGLTD